MNINITDKKVGAYIDELNVSRNKDLEELRATAENNLVHIILRETEGLMKILLNLKKPAHLLEIGTAVGYSACVFSDICGCRVTTIELDDHIADQAEENIRRLGFESDIEVLRGDGRDVLEKLAEEVEAGKREKFDLVFIDAAKSHYRKFWDLSLPMLNKGAMIVCDNVLMKGMTASDDFDTRSRYKTSIRHMRAFLKYITEVDYAKTTVLAAGDGMSISIIEGEE